MLRVRLQLQPVPIPPLERVYHIYFYQLAVSFLSELSTNETSASWSFLPFTEAFYQWFQHLNPLEDDKVDGEEEAVHRQLHRELCGRVKVGIIPPLSQRQSSMPILRLFTAHASQIGLQARTHNFSLAMCFWMVC